MPSQGGSQAVTLATLRPMSRIFRAAPLLVACALAAAVLSPVLGAGFFGDDYDLWHVGRELLSDPGIAFIGPQNFYRPANAWLFALHHLVFGTWAVGYHASTLLMHLGCGLLLACLLRRFGIDPWGAATAALLWMTSPYAFEPALLVNVSYNDLTVLLVWLGLACLWPDAEQPWGRGRLTMAVLLVVFSVFCKESWVIIAPLAVAFELLITGGGLGRALRLGSWLAAPVGAYVIAYSLIFSGRGDYYELGGHVLAKVPHLWACFSLVGTLDAYKPGFGAAEAVGLVLMALAVVIAWRRRCRLTRLGLLWFLLTLLPVLPVAFVPTRYTAAPLVGFILAMAGVLRALLAVCPEQRRRAAGIAVLVLVTGAVMVGAVRLRGELADMDRVVEAHEVLLAEAEKLAPHLPADLPLVCVRIETTEPLYQLHAEGYAGVQKLQFVRGEAPYGLVSWPALLTFIRYGHGDEVYLDAAAGELALPEYAVLAHVEKGFRFLEPQAATLAGELEAWTATGRPCRALVPVDSGGVSAPAGSTSGDQYDKEQALMFWGREYRTMGAVLETVR